MSSTRLGFVDVFTFVSLPVMPYINVVFFHITRLLFIFQTLYFKAKRAVPLRPKMEQSTRSVDGSLMEAFSSLSLRGNALPHESTPLSGINPFLNTDNTEQEPTQLETLIRDHLLPNLERRKNLLRLSPNHSFFQDARDLWEREGWDGEGLSNYITLLCGILNFPAILLLNPSGWDHLPWDHMIQNSPTLRWLQQMLGSCGLTMRDIIIIDAFPLLTDRDMNDMEKTEKLRLSNEVFKLTVKFLRRFKPPIMISCQCSSNPSNRRWGIVKDPLAALLCSSVGAARRREVATIALEEHTTHIVQGFHPMHIERDEDLERRSDLDQVLRSILEALYRPCADWKDRQSRECERNLNTTAEEARVMMRAFLHAITAHRQCQQRASKFGTSSARLGRLYDIHAWVKFSQHIHSFVSPMIPESS